MKTVRIGTVSIYNLTKCQSEIKFYLSNRREGVMCALAKYAKPVRFDTEFEAYKYARMIGYNRVEGINAKKKKAFASVYNTWKDFFKNPID